MLSAAYAGPNAVAVGDWNADGLPDLLAASGATVSVYAQTHDQSALLPLTSYTLSFPVDTLAVGDVDADGRADLVVGSRSVAPFLAVLLRGATGSLNAAPLANIDAMGINWVGIGDLDRTGTAQTVAIEGSATGSRIFVIERDLLGVYFPTQILETGLVIENAVLADVDGNGTLDLLALTSNPAQGTSFSLFRRSLGSFGAPAAVLPGDFPGVPAAIGELVKQPSEDLCISSPAVRGLCVEQVVSKLPAVQVGCLPELQPSGTLQFEFPFYEVNSSAGTVTVRVSREGGGCGSASVDWTVSGGSAAANVDYAGTPGGQFSWRDGETDSKSITFTLLNDPGAASDRSLTLTLSKPAGAGLGTNPITTVTIHETTSDEPSPSSSSGNQTSPSGSSNGTATKPLREGVDPVPLLGAIDPRALIGLVIAATRRRRKALH
jgi:hypothetical protein